MNAIFKENFKWMAVVPIAFALISISGGALMAEEQVPASVSTESPFKAAIDRAVALKASGDLIKARDLYKEIIVQYPNAVGIKDVWRQIWDLNVAIIFSSLQTHQTEIYVVEQDDTLQKIARKFGTTIELIKRRNHLETDRIKPGQKLSIWLGTFTIVIDKSDNTLSFMNGSEIVKIYQVSTGKNNSSPTGNFFIKYRYTDPVWFHKGDVVAAKSPKNYLGTRWLGFDLPKYGIHGTIEPEFIGKQVSSGCIRMRNQDVQELYEMIPIGTSVAIVE